LLSIVETWNKFRPVPLKPDKHRHTHLWLRFLKESTKELVPGDVYAH